MHSVFSVILSLIDIQCTCECSRLLYAIMFMALFFLDNKFIRSFLSSDQLETFHLKPQKGVPLSHIFYQLKHQS